MGIWRALSFWFSLNPTKSGYPQNGFVGPPFGAGGQASCIQGGGGGLFFEGAPAPPAPTRLRRPALALLRAAGGFRSRRPSGRGGWWVDVDGECCCFPQSGFGVGWICQYIYIYIYIYICVLSCYYVFCLFLFFPRLLVVGLVVGVACACFSCLLLWFALCALFIVWFGGVLWGSKAVGFMLLFWFVLVGFAEFFCFVFF